MNTEKDVATEPNHKRAQDEIRELENAIRGLHSLADKIEHGNTPVQGSGEVPDSDQSVSQFLADLPKELANMVTELRNLRDRISGLLF